MTTTVFLACSQGFELHWRADDHHTAVFEASVVPTGAIVGGVEVAGNSTKSICFTETDVFFMVKSANGGLFVPRNAPRCPSEMPMRWAWGGAGFMEVMLKGRSAAISLAVRTTSVKE